MISFTKNQAKIILPNSLYFPQILERAVKDFSNSCKIKLSKDALLSYVTIFAKKHELEEIAYDFCNYVLALMKDAFVERAHYIKK